MLEYPLSGGIAARECLLLCSFHARLPPMPPSHAPRHPISVATPHLAIFPQESMTHGPRALPGQTILGAFVRARVRLLALSSLRAG